MININSSVLRYSAAAADHKTRPALVYQLTQPPTMYIQQALTAAVQYVQSAGEYVDTRSNVSVREFPFVL